MACELEKLLTETPNANTEDIDKKTPLEIVRLMNEEDKKVALAVEKEIPNIAKAVEKIEEAFKKDQLLNVK